MTDDAFDDIDALRIDPSDLAFASKAKGNAKAKAESKWQRRFVRVPWSWIDRLKTTNRVSTYRLALYLIYEAWRNDGRPIRLANVALAEDGITRSAKRMALEELEQLGLIKVRRRPRKSPLVTVILDPRTGAF
jgi:hypothetical protein